MNERIKQIRLNLGLTQQRFAERIGLKQNSIALIESGKRNISDQAILSICREYSVNEEWLRYGSGDMFSPEPEDELQVLTEKYGLTAADRTLIEKFLALKAESRNAVIHFIEDVATALTSDGMYEEVPDSGDELEDVAPPVGSEIKSDVG